MEINVQFVKMPTSQTMEAFVNRKLQKLSTKYSWVIRAEVFYKLENGPKKNDKVCDIQLSLSGPRIFASSHAENFEMATDKSINDLEVQLKKRKIELKPHMK